MGLEEFSDEDLAVGEGFFDDEGVLGVVLEWVADGGGLGGCLGGVVVAHGLDDSAEFPVGVGETGMRFLNVHAAELDAVVGFCKPKACGEVSSWKLHSQVDCLLTSSSFNHSVHFVACIHGSQVE